MSQCRLHSAFHHPVLRDWNSLSSKLSPECLVYPLFVTDKSDDAVEEIKSLPGQSRFGVDALVKYLEPLVNGDDCFPLKSVMLFGVPTNENMKKDNCGSGATNPEGPVIRAIEALRMNFPNLLICVDVCMCAYTDHGHCGVTYADGTMNNKASTKRLGEIAAAYAKHGAHVVAPSDMMDGRVRSIKEALANAELDGKTSVWSYSSKFASCFYGPFRDAANSAPAFGDRRRYQLPPGSRGLAMKASDRDAYEGADMLMVKPASCYGHIIAEIKRNHPYTPLGVYHVSGEYATLWHSAKAGVFELKSAVMEVFTSLRCAGADVIITYYAPQVLKWLKEEEQ